MSTRYTLDNFDPNQMVGIWATVTIDRGGRGFQFKTYAKRQGALNKLANNPDCALYEWDAVDGRWREVTRHKTLADLPHGSDTRCEQCDGPIKDPNSNSWDNHGKFEYRRSGGKILEPPTMMWLCQACRRAGHGY